MKNRAFTLDLIQSQEGLRLKLYKCPAGKWSIGYGRNMEDKGISHKEAFYLLNNDIEECVDDLCRILPGKYNELSARRQSALISMRFQLGPGGFRGFRRMIAAINSDDYIRAASEMRNSKWHEQTKNRVEELATLMEKG